METMGMGSVANTSFADRAVEQLRDWPSLRICRADCGPGRGVALSTRQIVHLHGDTEAEVRLTWPVHPLLERSMVQEPDEGLEKGLFPTREAFKGKP
jgi:hypothetical protein